MQRQSRMSHRVAQPPRELNEKLVGVGDFAAIGNLFVDLYKSIADLQPTERVLDIGCGSGRMAIPLSGYLTSGTYRGIDVSREAIDWCRSNISSQFPSFQFDHVDAGNSFYNPEGTVRADEYRLPYSDGTFDFVAASSLYTHLMPGETRNYLRETYRVLRPGGRCLATFFMIDAEAAQLIAEGHSTIVFHEHDGCYVHKVEIPAWAVAYSERDLHKMFSDAKLRIDDIKPGIWCGRSEGASYQDLVLAPRP
jgi:SAM-dependent methyltransferase